MTKQLKTDKNGKLFVFFCHEEWVLFVDMAEWIHYKISQSAIFASVSIFAVFIDLARGLLL